VADELEKPTLAKALATSVEETFGGFYMPTSADVMYQYSGLSPEKLMIPKDYHHIIRMCYDFYQRGGSITKVIDRLEELAITELRNGQRKTTDEQNEYFRTVLHDKPARLMRFLHNAAREYFLSGMILPKIEWIEKKGRDISPDLTTNKTYVLPQLDMYPPSLVKVVWVGWGRKAYYLKVTDSDRRAIKNKGGKIKEQQLKYKMWTENFPSYVSQIESGAQDIEILDSDPILRKELSISPYPTPYLYNVLESLVFKQQLRRMDFAVAARVINAVLLVQEGDKDFPITEETNGNLLNLQTQILARSGDPRKMERLFVLFSNHTTKMTWITPDVTAMLDQDKYREVNEELDEGLGFPGILLTGSSRQGSQASEVSTWAIQPQMEELRSALLEWINTELYWKASDLNGFRNRPAPSWKTIKLQDFIKTAAVFQQLYAEGNVSRITRDDMAGIDFETEAELMKDEAEIAKGLPAFTPTPYSPPPPMIGQNPGTNGAGRPTGSQNRPVNQRNSGTSLKGKPTSKVKAASTELLPDEDVIELINKVAEQYGLIVTTNDIIEK
jgi:hypothetical protein